MFGDFVVQHIDELIKADPNDEAMHSLMSGNLLPTRAENLALALKWCDDYSLKRMGGRLITNALSSFFDDMSMIQLSRDRATVAAEFGRLITHLQGIKSSGWLSPASKFIAISAPDFYPMFDRFSERGLAAVISLDPATAAFVSTLDDGPVLGDRPTKVQVDASKYGKAELAERRARVHAAYIEYSIAYYARYCRLSWFLLDEYGAQIQKRLKQVKDLDGTMTPLRLIDKALMKVGRPSP